MNKLTKINIVIFSLFVLITLVFNILKYKNTSDLLFIFLILFFNLCLGLLSIFIFNSLIKVSKRSYSIFVFYLIAISFLYWYFVSLILHFYYGSFLSLGGIYYFIATRTYFMSILFYIFSGFLIISLSFLFSYFSKEYILKENKSGKTLSKKMKAIIFLIPIFMIILILIAMPFGQAYKASPVIELATQLIWSKLPGDLREPEFIRVGEKILDFSLDIEKPNIIFIMLESISADHITPYGYDRNITPNMEEFSKRAFLFEKAYSTSAHSDYSQTAFLSSRYPLTNDYRNFFDISYPREFIWDVLDRNNYTSLYISSQDDNWANMINYYNLDTLDFYHYSLSDGTYDYGSGNARKDYDEDATKVVIEKLEDVDSPFFLYVNFQGSHYPYSYPENNSLFSDDEVSLFTNYFYIDETDYESSLNRYDNSIFYVDAQVGLILDYLEDKNLFEDTIIVITSDHGEILEPRHGNLRHGFGVYEEEVNVPLMIYFPGKEPEIVEERVRHLDVVPTILDIANISLSKEFQGEHMTKSKEIFLVTQIQTFKLGLIKNNVKYVLDGLNYVSEVYDLINDPDEQNNLVKTPKDEKFYYSKYGYILYRWYNCQVKYYEKEKYLKGKKINCN